MDQEYSLSKIKAKFKSQVEADLEKTFSEIDFEGIFNKILSKLGLKLTDIDFNSEAVQNALRKAFVDAFNGGISGAVQEIKNRKYDIDLSDLFKLKENDLIKEVEKTYQALQDAINKKDKKLQNQLQQRLVEIVSYGQSAKYPKFQFDDRTKNKTPWQNAYNGLMSGIKASEKMAETYKEMAAQIKDMVQERGMEIFNKMFEKLDLTDWTDDAKAKIQAAFIELKNEYLNGAASLGNIRKQLENTYTELNKLPKKPKEEASQAGGSKPIEQAGTAAEDASKKVANLVEQLKEYKKIAESMKQPEFTKAAQDAMQTYDKYAKGLSGSLDDIVARFKEEIDFYKQMKTAYKAGGAVSFIDSFGSQRFQTVRKEDLEDQKQRLVALMQAIKSEGGDPFEHLNKTLSKDLSKTFEAYVAGLKEWEDESRRADEANVELESSLDKIEDKIISVVDSLTDKLNIGSILYDLKIGFIDVENAASRIEAIINKPETEAVNIWKEFRDRIKASSDELKAFAEEYKKITQEYSDFSNEEAGITKIQNRLKELYSFRKQEGFEKQFGNEIVALLDLLEGAGASTGNKNIEKYFATRFQEARELLNLYGELSKLAPNNAFNEWQYNTTDTRSVEEFADAMFRAQDELQKFYQAFPSKEKASEGLYAGFEEVQAKYTELVQQLTNGTINAQDAIEVLNKEIAKGVPFQKQQTQAQQQEAQTAGQTAKSVKELVQEWRELNELTKSQSGDELDKTLMRMREVLNLLEQGKAGTGIADIVANSQLSLDEAASKIEKIQKKLNTASSTEKASEQADTMGKKMQQAGQAGSEASKQIAEGLIKVSGIIENISSALTDIKNVLGSVNEENGFKPIIENVNTLLSKLDEAKEKIELQIKEEKEAAEASKEKVQAEEEANRLAKEAQIEKFVAKLENISSALTDIRSVLGNISEENGFKPIIESVNTLLLKLDEVKEKVGTGVYNIQINKNSGAANNEAADQLLRNRRSEYNKAFENVARKAGGEDMLFNYINSAINFRGGVDKLYQEFSPVNIGKIESVEQQIHRYMDFFKILKQAIESPYFGLDIKASSLPTTNDIFINKQLNNLGGNAFQNLLGIPEATNDINGVITLLKQIQELLTTISNNTDFSKIFDQASEKIQQLVPILTTLSGLNFSGLSESLDKLLQSQESTAFTELSTAIENVNQSLKAKNELLGDELNLIQLNIPLEIEAFRLLDEQISKIAEHLNLIQTGINSLSGIHDIISAISNGADITRFLDQLQQIVTALTGLSNIRFDGLSQLSQIQTVLEAINTALETKNSLLNEEVNIVNTNIPLETNQFQSLDNSIVDINDHLAQIINGLNFTGITDNLRFIIERLGEIQRVLEDTKFKEVFDTAFETLQQFVPVLVTLSELRFDGLVESFYKFSSNQGSEAFAKLQGAIEGVNKSIELKNSLIDDELMVVNTNIPYEINEFKLLDDQIVKVDEHLAHINETLNANPDLLKNVGNVAKAKNASDKKNANRAYNNLVRDEIKYQNLVARQADDPLSINAKEKEDLALLAARRSEYQALIQTVPELAQAYENERQQAEALAEQYIKDKHIDLYIKQYQRLEEAIANVNNYSEQSRTNANNLMNSIPTLDIINNSNIDDIKAYNEQLLDMLNNMEKVNSNKAFEKLSKTEHTYQQLLAKQNYGQLTASETDRLNRLQQERDVYKQVIDSIDELRIKYEALQAQEKQNAETLFKSKAITEYIKNFEKLQEIISNKKKYTSDSIKDVQAKFGTLPTQTSISQESIDSIRAYNEQILDLMKNVDKLGNETKLRKLIVDIDKTLDQNTRMPSKLAKEFTNLRSVIEKLLTSGNYLPEQVKEISNTFLSLESQMIRTGKTGRSFFSMIKNDIITSSARTISMYVSFYRLIGYVRSAITAIKDLDSALTQLKIVSGATESELNNVSNTAFELANRLGSTTTEVISSITEWRRLGKTIEDSMALAEQAQRLATGGLMDVNSATTSLISSMQAFEIGVDDVSKVVDQYIYLGNNYAISSEQLATSLTKSMAALKVAGNSLEQIEALEIAGNTIVQDADVVSNSLKVLSMRLRGTTGSALEEIGEDTEGLIENFSKLNGKIKALTKTASNPQGVSIVDEQTKAYKSTYDILLDISKVWEDIGDMQKAELLEVIAGKTRATAAAAILESPDILQRAYEDARFNSSGAGAKAVETSVESVEARIKILGNNLKKLGQDFIGSEVVKNVTDSLTGAVQEINKSAQNMQPVIKMLTDLFNLITKIVGALPSGGIIGGILGFKNRNNLMGLNVLHALDNRGIVKLPIQESDVEIFQKYTKQVQEGTFDVDVWNNTMGHASKAARQLAASQLNAGKSYEEVTNSLKNATKATNGMRIAQTALNMVMTMAISIIVTKLISAISTAIHSQEEFAKSAQDVAHEFDQEAQSIDSYKQKISDLQGVLSDEKASTSDIINTRQELHKIQKDLVEQYGHEAEVINLVTDAINGEAESLENLKRLKWSETLAEFEKEHESELGKNDSIWDWLISATQGNSWVGQAASKVMSDAGFDTNLHKTSAQFAYEEWLNGDERFADFAKMYMQYEVLEKQYKEQYDSLTSLADEYTKKLIDNEVTDEVIKSYHQQYTDILDGIQDNKVRQKIQSEFFSELAINENEYNKMIERRGEIKGKASDLFYDQLFKNDPNATKDIASAMDVVGRFNALNIDTERELDTLISVADEAKEQGINDINEIFDLYESRLIQAEYEASKVKIPSLTDWYTKSSEVKNGTKNYTNSELIDAYESSIKSLGEYVQQNEQGQVEIDFGKILKFTANDNLLQQLGMDNFDDYIKKFGKSTTAIFAYVQDAEKKLKNNLDMDFQDKDVFYETLEKIKIEALGGSVSVDKLEESYQELNSVLNDIKEGHKYSEEQMTYYINKYPELKSAVKKYAGDSYSFQKDSIENLIDSYIELENTAISTLYEEKKATLQATIATANLGLSVNEVVKAYKSMFDEAGKRKIDVSGHDYEYMFGDLSGTGISREEIEKQAQEVIDIRELAEKQLRELIGSGSGSGSGSGNGSDNDNRSNFDWLDIFLEKVNRRLERTQTLLDNLGKTDIINDLRNRKIPKEIDKQLKKLGKGGNVNLRLRPEIDAEELNKAGWDAGEGVATVFSSTYSNKKGNLAMNFTPIIVDPKTGEYKGVLTPDELQKYAEEVIAGTRTDDLNLQIGAAFTGKKAIENAEKAAIKIHELHEDLAKKSTYDIDASYYDKREKQIKEVNKELLKQQKAYQKAEAEHESRLSSGEIYDNLVKALGGDTKKADKYIAKIKAGKDIKLEGMDSELQSALSAAVDEWNKKNDAADKQVEIGFQIKENDLLLVQNQFEEIITKYDKVLNVFEQRQSELEHYQNMRTTSGYMANRELYIALIANETRELAANIEERDRLAQTLEGFMPTTKDELDYWNEQKDKINECTQAIWENQESIAQWQNEVKKLEWELDDKIMELTYGINDEADFLIKHLATGDADMFGYTSQYLGSSATKTKIYDGKMSDAGLATMALRLTKYQAYLEQIDKYGQMIAEAEAEYLKDPANLENLERLNSLKEAQRQAIEGYDAEKEAVIALVKEGYDKQLESLQNISDAYMEALRSERELFEYQRNISKQTKNIADLRKKISAYANDSSEEARMRLQQLTVQLQEAEESRADTEYERYLQDQQEILDRMYQSMEDYFNDKLSDTDKILEESKTLIEGNIPDIKKTLKDSLQFDQDVTAKMSDTLNNVLDTNISNIANNIASTDADIQALEDSVITKTNELIEYYKNYQLSQEEKEQVYNWIKNLSDKADEFLGENGKFESTMGQFSSGITDVITSIEMQKFESDLDDFFAPFTTPTSSIGQYYQGLNKSALPAVTKNTNADVSINTTIKLDNVTDYNSFIAEAKRDKSFEKYLQEVTINQLQARPSSVRKYNI